MMAPGLIYSVAPHRQGRGLSIFPLCPFGMLAVLRLAHFLVARWLQEITDGLSLVPVFKNEDILSGCFPANFL